MRYLFESRWGLSVDSEFQCYTINEKHVHCGRTAPWCTPVHYLFPITGVHHKLPISQHWFTRVYFKSQKCYTINEKHVHCGCIGPYITYFPTLISTRFVDPVVSTLIKIRMWHDTSTQSFMSIDVNSSTMIDDLKNTFQSY